MSQESQESPPVDRRRWIIVGAVLLVAAVLVVVVLSLNGPPASSPSSEDFTSVMEIVEAINAGGIECVDGKVFEEVRTKDSESGLCYVMGGEFEIDIYVYSSPELRSLSVSELRSVYEREVVVDSNWYLTTGDLQLSRDIAEVLGGRVVKPE